MFLFTLLDQDPVFLEDWFRTNYFCEESDPDLVFLRGFGSGSNFSWLCRIRVQFFSVMSDPKPVFSLGSEPDLVFLRRVGSGYDISKMVQIQTQYYSEWSNPDIVFLPRVGYGTSLLSRVGIGFSFPQRGRIRIP